VGVNEVEDIGEMLSLLNDAACHGSAEALMMLGQVFDEGLGSLVKVDKGKAARWVNRETLLLRDCQIYQTVGCGEIEGLSCFSFSFIPFPPLFVFSYRRWFNLGASKGHAESQYLAARCYMLGTGVAQDLDRALGLCRASASQGFASGIQTLICILELVKHKAETGEAIHQNCLGKIFLDGMSELKIDVDRVRALELFDAAAAQGITEASLNAGIAHIRSADHSNEYSIKAKHISLGVECYRAAAEKGAGSFDAYIIPVSMDITTFSARGLIIRD